MMEPIVEQSRVSLVYFRKKDHQLIQKLVVLYGFRNDLKCYCWTLSEGFEGDLLEGPSMEGPWWRTPLGVLQWLSGFDFECQ